MADVRFQIDNEDVSLHELRERLRDETMRVILVQVLETLRGPTGTAQCSVHQKSPQVTISLANSDELSINVSHCCRAFAERRTAPLVKQTDRFKTGHFRPDMKLIVNVQGDPYPFVFDASQIETLIIGREDAQTDEQPDINLQAHGGAHKGVSRRHASIVWKEHALHIVDNNSSNGTYVDERRLEPHQPHMLHDGDLIRLGELVLEVQLVDTAEA